MTESQKNEITDLITESLNDAESVWNEVGHHFSITEGRAVVLAKAAANTRIPGHPIIEDGAPKVDDFICLIADMRDSTKHMLHHISQKTTSVNTLQRVYYETSALLPALAMAIDWDRGSVTEYLGDGILALFNASANRADAVYSSHRAAKNCMQALEEVINPILQKRYQLPELEIGIGIAFSKAVVTLVGLEDNKLPKVFGECVFRASKLANKRNEIVIDVAMKNIWPTAKDGKISFKEVSGRSSEIGYLIQNPTKRVI